MNRNRFAGNLKQLKGKLGENRGWWTPPMQKDWLVKEGRSSKMASTRQRSSWLLTFISVLPVLMGLFEYRGEAFAAEKVRVRLKIDANTSWLQDNLKQCIPRELEHLYGVELVASDHSVDLLVTGQVIPNTNICAVSAALATSPKVSGECRAKVAQSMATGAKGEVEQICHGLVATSNFKDFLAPR
jgi:hypothetical protein